MNGLFQIFLLLLLALTGFWLCKQWQDYQNIGSEYTSFAQYLLYPNT